MRYYNHSTELYHHGIKGQKWGIRRFQNKDGSLTKAGEKRYSEESDKKIQTNHDGSKIIPVGFKFNRVGRSTIDVNKSGGLYVSYGKEDAARYIKSLGPTLLGKLFKTAGNTVKKANEARAKKYLNDKKKAKNTPINKKTWQSHW